MDIVKHIKNKKGKTVYEHLVPYYYVKKELGFID